MVANIKEEHIVICDFLDDIEKSPYQDAIKKIQTLKNMLVNHFFEEDFVLMPYIKNRYLSNRSTIGLSLFDVYEIDEGRDDMSRLLKSMDGRQSVIEKVFSMLSDCLSQNQGEKFWCRFRSLCDFLKERIKFEDAVLGNRASPRVSINISVKFEIKGNVLKGTTKNISQTGCLFGTVDPNVPISIDERGLLSATVVDEFMHILCTVKRLSVDLIAVQFLDHCPDSMMEKFILIYMENKRSCA